MRSTLLFVFAALLLAGCPSKQLKTSVRPEVRDLRVEAVVVYPYRFKWAEAPWRHYQQARTVTDALVAEERFLVVGPTEISVQRPDDDDVVAASTLLPRIREVEVSPGRTVVFRMWASQRIDRSQTLIYDEQGEAVGLKDDARRTLTAHLEVVHAGSGRKVIEARQKVVLDPFEERPEWDPLEPLTEANRALVRWASDRLRPGIDALPSLGAELVANPVMALDGAAASLPSDRIAATAARLSVYAFFDPELPPERVRLYERAKRGVVVRAVSGDPAQSSGLRPDDVITRCEDRPVTGAEVVVRLLHHARRAVRLEVLRDGETTRVILRRPD